MGPVSKLAGLLSDAGGLPFSPHTLPPDVKLAARKLTAWGLAEASEPEFLLASDVSLSDINLFSRMIDAFQPELRQVSLKECPVCFCTGLARIPEQEGLENGGGGAPLAAGGQGDTPGRAALSCLGEMAERISLFTVGIADPRISRRTPELNDLPLGPVAGYSANQECELNSASRKLDDNESPVPVAWNELSDRRVLVTNLHTNQKAYFPAYGVLFGEKTREPLALPAFASTSGTAVWRDLEGAVLRGVYELVERDAFAQAWYNRLGITRLNLDVREYILPKKIFGYLQSRSRHSGLYRVDTDQNAHVIAAISHGENGLGACLGVSAAADASHAARSAVNEMLQAELSLQLAAAAFKAGHARGERQGMPKALQMASTLNITDELDLDSVPEADGKLLDAVFEPDAVLQSCREKGIELWQFDATRPDIGVPCAKLISPQLCSWQPRFGKDRLYKGVVERGLAPVEAREQDFAARPFPF